MEVETPLAPRAAVEEVLADAGQRSRLIAYARARFGIDAENAEDLLQETALEVLRQRSLVRRPRGLVFTVFHARCCRFVRGLRASRQVFAMPGCDPQLESPAAEEGIDSLLTVQQAFEEISASCRKLLHAYYLEGRSLKEAADVMALAYSGVWKTISRCLKKLRRCLA